MLFSEIFHSIVICIFIQVKGNIDRCTCTYIVHRIEFLDYIDFKNTIINHRLMLIFIDFAQYRHLHTLIASSLAYLCK